jgi:hypothetical protein
MDTLALGTSKTGIIGFFVGCPSFFSVASIFYTLYIG